jgi:phage-related protein
MKRVLRYEGRVLKDLKRLDQDTQTRILTAMERFARTGDGDVRPLRGEFAGSYLYPA